MYKKILWVLVLWLSTQMAWADCGDLPLSDCDEAKVERRTPSKSALDDIATDPAFDYDSQRPPDEASFFQRFWSWFWDRVGDFFDALFEAIESIFTPIADYLPTDVTTFTRGVIYVCMSILLAAIVYMLVKSNFTDAAATNQKANTSGFTLTEEDLKASNYDLLIAQALQEGKYRLGIRYLYLQMLQRLIRRKMIVWQADKTNRDYLHELPSGKVSTSFSRLSLLFEYVWYGEFPVSQEQFERYRTEFSTFEKEGLK